MMYLVYEAAVELFISRDNGPFHFRGKKPLPDADKRLRTFHFFPEQ